MKRRILFVDDEPLVLQGLQRMLRPLRDQWDMTFLDGGRKALQAMEIQAFDVVVADMRMPAMNGAQLLDEVMQRHPATVRFILSGHADQNLVMRSIGAAHQFLAKPCGPDELKAAIQRAATLEKSLKNASLRRLAAQIDRLPSVPSLYIEITEKLRNQESSLEEIGRLIATDVGMTAKILKLVNSAFFGLPRELSSPAEAVAYLGVDTVRSLVLSSSVFAQLEPRECGSFCVESLWKHSLRVASGARAIAKTERAGREIIDHATGGGMLHDVGKLVFASKLTKEYEEVLRRHRNEGLALTVAEEQVLAANHADFGGYLLGLWGLPVAIVDAIAFHHEPSMAGGTGFSAVTAVHAANALCGGSPVDPAHLERLGLADRGTRWRDAVSEEIAQ